MVGPIGTGQPVGPIGGFGPSFGGAPSHPAPVMGGPRGWQGMLVGGIMFLLIGFVQIAVIGAMTSDPAFSGMGFGDAPYLIAGVVILIGLVLIVLSFSTRSSDMAAAQRQAEAMEQARKEQERHEEEERQKMVDAIKSTIKVRCRYCGSLNDETAKKCESCGADL